MRWYIVTGEYPPELGGVSDYTSVVAEALVANGETVEVFVPSPEDDQEFSECRNGVNIRWLPDHFCWRGLARLKRSLANAPAGGRLLVQYVPHAFGWKAMNIPLILWLSGQRRHSLWV